jgi:hypothetical protein
MGMKFSLKDLDWKKVLLEKGEKIGLGVAGLFAALMVLPFLWYMVAGSGPGANAETLKNATERLEKAQANSTPTDNPSGDTTVVIKNVKIEDTTPYQLATLTSGGAAGDANKRKEPFVLSPVEVIISIVRPQVVSYVFNDALDKIYVVASTDATSSNTGNKGNKPGNNPYGRGGGFPGGPPGMRGGGGVGPGGLGRPPGGPGGQGGGTGGKMGGPNLGSTGQGILGPEDKKDLTPLPIPLDKLADQQRLERVLALRQVELNFAFPLREQAEEFERKLNLPDYNALLADQSGEKDKEGNRQPSFRFMGFNLKRQKLDASGKVLEDWTAVPLNETFKPYLFLNGKRLEPDPPELEAIKVTGLVMPRLLAKSPDQYPRTELKLPKISETLLAVAGKNAPVLPGSNPLNADDFDIFNPKPEEGSGGSSIRGGMGVPPGMMGGKGAGGPSIPGSAPGFPGGGQGIKPGGPGGKFPGGPAGPMLPGGGSGRPGSIDGPGAPQFPGAPTNSALEALPDYCLGRVIDLTVEPGFTYRYQFQIKMGNPNKDLKNVLSPSYAEKPYLLSDWYEVKEDVVVPQETYVYALDQKAIEKDYKGQNSGYTLQKGQAVFQMHKWLERMPLPNNPKAIEEIGEWVVAERVPVSRGEYLGRNQRVQVPVWKPTQDAFILMGDKAYNSRYPAPPGVPVNFSQPDGSDLILVDFDGGEAKYELASGKGQISEPCETEAIVLAPDGRLLVHDSIMDSKDQERDKRLKAYRERIEEVKKGGKPEAASPFSGGRGNGPSQ